MRSPYVLVATLCLATMTCGHASESFVGREVPPVPPGCEHEESGILDGSHKLAYEVLACKEEGEVVLLERFIERRGTDAYWQVIDELRLPVPGEKGLVRLDVPYCSSSDYEGSHVLAVGAWKESSEGNSVAERISHAWRFNLESGRIEAIAVRGVQCEFEDVD